MFPLKGTRDRWPRPRTATRPTRDRAADTCVPSPDPDDPCVAEGIVGNRAVQMTKGIVRDQIGEARYKERERRCAMLCASAFHEDHDAQIRATHHTEAQARCLPLLNDLLELYPSLAGQLPSCGGTTANQVAHLAHGWYLRCHRGVESILLLDQAGYSEEASPLRRSVIEHCIALRWVAAEGDAVLDTIARGHARDSRKRGDAASQAGWTSVDMEYIESVTTEINPEKREKRNDNLLAFAHRLVAYGDKHSLPGYLAECARAHPGYESAIAYVDVDDATLLWESHDSLWQVPFCTTHLLEALHAFQKLFTEPPWEEALVNITRAFTSVTDTVRKDDGLPEVDWSTGRLRDT